MSTRRTRGSFFDSLTAARNVSCTTVPPSRRQEPCPGGAETRKGAGSIVASKSSFSLRIVDGADSEDPAADIRSDCNEVGNHRGIVG